MKFTTILPLFVLALAGCKGGDTTVVDGKTPAATGTTGAPAKEQSGPDRGTIPQNLKHAAFEYYGLGNTKSMDVTLKAPDVAEKTGGVSIDFEKMLEGKAYFKVTRTGAVAEDLGNDSVMVDSTGVYMVGTSIGTISPNQFLALPADVTPGKTWMLKTKVTRDDNQEIEEDSTYKIVGVQDVKTKAGTQKALLVTSDGFANVSVGTQKQKAKYQTKSWYVKGVGPVRIEISLTPTGQATRTLVVEQSS